jgi:hypothetical protein
LVSGYIEPRRLSFRWSSMVLRPRQGIRQPRSFRRRRARALSRGLGEMANFVGHAGTLAVFPRERKGEGTEF